MADDLVNAVLSIPITVILTILLVSLVAGVGLYLEFARPVPPDDDTAEFAELMDDLRKARQQ